MKNIKTMALSVFLSAIIILSSVSFVATQSSDDASINEASSDSISITDADQEASVTAEPVGPITPINDPITISPDITTAEPTGPITPISDPVGSVVSGPATSSPISDPIIVTPGDIVISPPTTANPVDDRCTTTVVGGNTVRACLAGTTTPISDPIVSGPIVNTADPLYEGPIATPNGPVSPYIDPVATLSNPIIDPIIPTPTLSNPIIDPIIPQPSGPVTPILEPLADPQCYNSVQNIPATCSGGTITQDTWDGCRTLVCTTASSSLQVQACNKPDTGDLHYFEMYRQSNTGEELQLCIGKECLSSTGPGFTQSSNFPICTGSTGKDVTPPLISKGQPSGTLSGGTTAVILSVATDEDAQCMHSNLAGQSHDSMIKFTNTGRTAHSTKMAEMQNGKSYKEYVKCLDNSGNINQEDYVITFSVGTSQSASVSVAQGYPKDNDYVFQCDVSGFTPTSYSWIFGDGHTQNDMSVNNVYHIYSNPGTYKVSCSATDGTNTVQDSMTINVAGGSPPVANITQDYYGYIDYMPNYTYYFYVNHTAHTIAFDGLNASNQQDHYVVQYDSQNKFVKRINYVWFSGSLDNQNLYLDQYVETGDVYSDSAYETSPGVYFADFVFPGLPYTGLSNVSANFVIDTNTGQNTIYPTQYPQLTTTASIDSAWQTSGHAYGAVLVEPKLLLSGTQAMMEVALWVKEDLGTNGMNPMWTSPLTPVSAPIVVEQPTTNSTNNPGAETSTQVIIPAEEEGNGRRASLRVTNLANPSDGSEAQTPSDDQTINKGNEILSKISSAMGERGMLLAGLLIVIIGLIGLVSYNGKGKHAGHVHKR